MPWPSWDQLPDWASPDGVHQLLVQWLGHPWAERAEIALVGIAVGGLLVRFVLVPLGLRRRS